MIATLKHYFSTCIKQNFQTNKFEYFVVLRHLNNLLLSVFCFTLLIRLSKRQFSKTELVIYVL